MRIEFQIRKIQHIDVLDFGVDLDSNQLTCIVGKNGAGKTTLIKAIQNLSLADTFTRTSPASIFNADSEVRYRAGEDEYRFDYDPKLRSLNCKTIIPSTLKDVISVELPMPFGQRFSFFQAVVLADLEIRHSIVLQTYTQPTELIEFLNDIYSSKKFDNLVEISIKGVNYYCIVLEESKYIREDHLSSGEYFLINLYRKVKEHCRLIVIDEIDISLDAAAQANLVRKLRDFCAKYKVNIVFTTHSLAMMKTLQDGELFYMQENARVVEIRPASYNYIKTILFGFKGWDKYILTEDERLQAFIEFLIRRYELDVFYQYKIIYIGGGSNVTNLMRRNAEEGFLAVPENVISVLDGDQRIYQHSQRHNVFCIPIESVEKKLFEDYELSADLPRVSPGTPLRDGKDLFNFFVRSYVLTENQIYKYICDKSDIEMRQFADQLRAFLSAPITP